jgi:hypothetical protein
MAQLSRPQTDISNSGWTAVPPPGAGETNPLSKRLNDFPNSDSTYVVSNPSPQGDSFTVKLAGLAWPNPNDPTPTILTVRLLNTAAGASSSAGGTAPATVVLFQGNTVIASWPLSPPSSFMDYPLTLGSDVLSKITNYANLYVEVIAGPVSNTCCPPALPDILHATFGVSVNPCSCLNNLSVPLAWSASLGQWIGAFSGCGTAPTTILFTCASPGDPPTFQLTFLPGGCLSAGGASVDATCPPAAAFSATFRDISFGGCCSGTVNIQVTI